MQNHPMNRDEMERLGKILFGHVWKTKLADALEIDRRTVSRWIADDDVPPWAAEKLRLMVNIAPPPNTTDQNDRDDACQDAIEPEFTRLANTAIGAGWNRGEVMVALVALAVADIKHCAGDAAALEVLDQGVALIAGNQTVT